MSTAEYMQLPYLTPQQIYLHFNRGCCFYTDLCVDWPLTTRLRYLRRRFIKQICRIFGSSSRVTKKETKENHDARYNRRCAVWYSARGIETEQTRLLARMFNQAINQGQVQGIKTRQITEKWSYSNKVVDSKTHFWRH